MSTGRRGAAVERERGAAPPPRGRGQGPATDHDGGRSPAEWITFSISLAIILALVGLVTYQDLAGGDRPATIAARPQLDRVRQDGGRYYVPVEIVNAGDRTAEDVRVEFTLTDAGGGRETAELTVSFLAGGEKDRGVISFSSDPARGVLSVSGISFLRP